MSDTYGKQLKFVVFDVNIHRRWLCVPEAEQITKEFGLEFVHYELVNTDILSLNLLSAASSIQAKRNGILEDKIREVQIQNQHLKAILESTVEGIIVTDKSSHIVSINPTVEEIFKITKQDVEGKLFLEVIRNNDIAEIINNVLKNRRFFSCELSLVWPVQKIFRVDATPIFEKEMVSGCLVMVHDITEIRRLETMRKDFVANVSHELKTPLTSIKGFVETLIEGALEDKENSRHLYCWKFLEINLILLSCATRFDKNN
jgi:PAS domain S-box-containing protein